MIKLEVKVNDSNIVRMIDVNNKLYVDDLCEYIIVSLNGKDIEQYYLSNLGDNKEYFRYEEDVSETYLIADNYTVEDLNLSVNSELGLDYNQFEIKIKVIEVDDVNNKDDFVVTGAKYYGIINDDYIATTNLYFELKNKKRYKEIIEYYTKKYKISDFVNVDLEIINDKIKEYCQIKEERYREKSYEISASLEGFNKEIKRTVIVNSNMSLDFFVSMIVVTFNGDLSHLYAIRRNKKWYDPEDNYFLFDCPLSFMDLKEKEKFKVIYDYGDSWTINITIKKILEKNNDVDFQIVKGKGYGLIDDCGGIYGLDAIFNGDSSWYEDKEDCPKIDDFDLEELIKRLKRYFPNTKIK